MVYTANHMRLPSRFGIVIGIVAGIACMLATSLPTSAMTGPSDENWDWEEAATAEQQLLPASAFPPDEFMLGEVVEIVEKGERELEGFGPQPYQITRVRILDGAEKGKELRLEHAGVYNVVDEGDKVVLTKVTTAGESEYFIADEYRLPSIAFILACFFALAIALGRRHGFMSILGLGFSILVLAKYVVPKIIAGADPLAVTLTGAVAIIFVSISLAHGFNRRTAVAVGSTTLTLGIAAVLAVVFVNAAKLLGLGSEDAAYLQLGPLETISLKGLLLGGIIIGTLGVLDDVTTAQTAAVDEIGKADPSLGFGELYRRGLSVGREHIASLVNTLVLAYAGASLPLFLLFTLNKTRPLWVILNGESVAEEVIRTLVGSTSLMLAVPVSTALAAYVFSRRSLAAAKASKP